MRDSRGLTGIDGHLWGLTDTCGHSRTTPVYPRTTFNPVATFTGNAVCPIGYSPPPVYLDFSRARPPKEGNHATRHTPRDARHTTHHGDG
jgi:hypothetical protein